MTDSKNIPTQKAQTPHPQRVRHRPHIDLGDTRSESFGEWLYGHRVGLIAVIVCFMLGGIFIATARVDVVVRPIEYIVEFVETSEDYLLYRVYYFPFGSIERSYTREPDGNWIFNLEKPLFGIS